MIGIMLKADREEGGHLYLASTEPSHAMWFASRPTREDAIRACLQHVCNEENGEQRVEEFKRDLLMQLALVGEALGYARPPESILWLVSDIADIKSPKFNEARRRVAKDTEELALQCALTANWLRQGTSREPEG